MPYPLLTQRLRIEPLVPADAAAFTRYRQDPEVARYQSWPADFAEADAARLIAAQPPGDLPPAGAWLQLAVRARAGGQPFGDVGLHVVADQPHTVELGVTFSRENQGHGYATEALLAVLEELFTVHAVHRAIAHCDARNASVAAVLRRVGMRQEARALEADWFKGEWTTLDSYALLAREWPPPGGLPG